MIKSKLMMLLASTGLTIALGVGSFFMPSKTEAPNNDATKIQSNSETSSENKETKTDESNSVVETSKNTVASADKVSTESKTNENNESLNNKQTANSKTETGVQADQQTENKNSNEDCYTDGQYTPQQKPVVTPSQGSNSNSGQESNQKPNVSDSSSYIAEIEQAIFQRVNQERAAAGLPALSYNGTMEHYARIKSKDMGDRGYFDHKDPQGKLITEQMKADGVSYSAWGENIAYIQGVSGNATLATQFMDNWMNSSGHRANILSSNFSSIGIGVYKIGNTYYATQEFYR
ncbi:CAP domain-containing protein [Clostridium sp. 1001275B_160808_H3]|uniref:CAP domain-containing protein n=1 Tax=Clostridium sp. 1001275B_160808_H3 TaxID=2787110 RepID=UPI00189A6D33|nr:CAP domain-containing protein [Clostridium sp. 1001275B_160808_H3]